MNPHTACLKNRNSWICARVDEKKTSKAMNKGLTFGAGLGIGTIVMYVLDPRS
jgi:hypothetical protein